VLNFEDPTYARRGSTPLIIILVWGTLLFIMLGAGTLGYMIADQREHEVDPSVWRCVQYVPGTADCQWLERR
jgi:hypothetical protein